MRLYLDQCLRSEVTEFLRARGHDVARAGETGQARADDALVLEHATRGERVLVTLDEHFGDWVVLPLSRQAGVIRLKAHPPTLEKLTALLVPLLDQHTQNDFKNRLVIVSPRRIRWIRTADE